MELKPIRVLCVKCGKQATHAAEYSKKVAIPLCEACIKSPIRIAVLPTHEPSTLEPANKFPPRKGEWFNTPDGNLVLGCPQCGSVVSTTSIHKVESGKLKPSFICPECKLHLFLSLAEWQL